MRISFSPEKLRFSSLVRNSLFTIYALWAFYCLPTWVLPAILNTLLLCTVALPFLSSEIKNTSVQIRMFPSKKKVMLLKYFSYISTKKLDSFSQAQEVTNVQKSINSLRFWVKAPTNANINTVLTWISAFINTRESRVANAKKHFSGIFPLKT